MQKGFAPIILIIVVLVVSAGIVGGVYYFRKINQANQQTSKPTPPPTHQLNMTKEECERVTRKKCYLFKGFCQVMEAQNQSEAEANEKFLKDCESKIGTWLPIETVSPTSAQQPNSTDETSNWEKYTNNKYQFSIQHPSGWSVKEYPKKGYSMTNTYDRYIVDFREDEDLAEKENRIPGWVIIEVSDDSKIKNLSVQDYKGIDRSDTKVKWEDIKVDGRAGKQVSHQGCQSGDCFDVLVKQGQRIYDIGIPEQAHDKNGKRLAQFNQILSTFKFLDKKETSSKENLGMTPEQAALNIPLYPAKVTVQKVNNTRLIGWSGTGEDGVQYNIYRKGSEKDKWIILGKVGVKEDNKGNYEFKDTTAQSGQIYIYGVSIIGNYNSESEITISNPS